MKLFVKANSDSKNYIGGKLYELPDSYWDDYDTQEHRYEEQSSYIDSFSKNYIIYRPKAQDWKFDLCHGDPLLYDLTESLSIKDGIDVIAYVDYIEIVAYDGSYLETVYLYPISETKANELGDILDNSDFDRSSTLEMEIAQHSWSGASMNQILKSWR